MIVIDTHVLLWWVAGDTSRLSAAAVDALDDAGHGGAIRASAISAWEITLLHDRGRIGLSIDARKWLGEVEASGRVKFVPLDNEIAILGARLGPDFHKDPADRFIAATSQKLSVPLVTADEKIRNYPQIRTIW
ncbi:type II toxin-antitoxin system VapC family toxin [Mesorhizobium microcysteis]|uniref:Type II toxin-antitoxin system VapC family toxin n=1 Tax=Neoaquamicrobium microcysteis TaxID=2682781 RepID=A0A5D4H338_9HYPH|nr:type II toxin-antitoxin system VapC family toxin [Mesorhizobium microcysteis]TYR34934.1 type II toxin-antitoxin system VapC family toxin [Mesorhizobium microcysteis]